MQNESFLTTPLSRRGFLTAAAAGGLGMTGVLATGAPALARTATRAADLAFAKEVRDEFLVAWNAYKQFAWGHDEVLPLSGGFNDFFADGHPVGLTIVEALDTLYLMELDDELALGVDWIHTNLD